MWGLLLKCDVILESDSNRHSSYIYIYSVLYPPLAQLDRASPSGGEGQRFESSRAGHLSLCF